MTEVKGAWGRVVWLPTFDSENQVRYDHAKRPFAPVSRDGKLLPEVNQVISIVSKNNLTLETGHVSAEEGLMVIRAAKAAGVSRIVVTHAMNPPIRMSIEQMKQAAAIGAYIEFVYGALIAPGGRKGQFELPEFAAAIRAVGPEHCILSTDLGQAGNPLHPDGLEAFFRGLRSQGFSAEEIGRMSKTNPARLLGLE